MTFEICHCLALEDFVQTLLGKCYFITWIFTYIGYYCLAVFSLLQGQNVELESLCSILDPEADDIAIDIDTFRKGVLQWMSQVQEGKDDKWVGSGALCFWGVNCNCNSTFIAPSLHPFHVMFYLYLLSIYLIVVGCGVLFFYGEVVWVNYTWFR